MKHLMRILVLLVAFVTSNVVVAATVSVPTAKTVAFNFVKQIDSRVVNSSSLSLVYTSVQANKSLMYVFGYADGFVLVAADDRAFPILGYSTEKSFRLPQSDTDTVVGNNFWGMMKSYASQIQYVVDNNIPATDDMSDQWSVLLSGQSTRNTTTVVTPLLTTTWNQDWPYNSMCPVDAYGPGGHVYAGCVATAMSQILKYHNYPSQGLGSYGYQWGSYPTTTANFGATTYNWTGMPNSISTVDVDVATLIYQTAVSCRSMWGAGSTGVGYSSDQDPMSRAFVNYFKMAFSTIKYVRQMDYADADWNTLIQAELLASRPVYYRGDGVGSHGFVCDGVDASTLYHFNFGWGGAYNGYFALSAITPGANNFTNNQQAIIGIKPNDGSTLVVNTTWSGTMTKSTHVAIPDAITLTVTAGATIQFAQDCKLQIFGRVVSTGTSSNYAKFTAVNTSTGWGGIKWDNTYMGFEVMADNDSSKLIYTQVEYSKNSGIYCSAYGKVLIDHCKINDNHSDVGAGLSLWFHPITLRYTEIYNNHATVDAGGFSVSTTDTLSADISHNDIHDNLADAGGGGFFLFNTNLTLDNNSFHNNQSSAGGGGSLMLGTPTLLNNKFCNNSTTSSSGLGGGLLLDNCSANIVNNLFANNTAGSDYAGGGGGICVFTNSNPILLNNTIVNNSSHKGGGIIFANNANANVKNCIVYGNYAILYGNQIAITTTDSDPYFDHCDIQGGLAGFGGSGSGGNYNPANYTNNLDVPPLFVLPSAGAGSGYDGLTADWSLQSTSLCIDAGDITGVGGLLPALDLDGNPRINGVIDMGAYEYACTPVPVSVTIVANNNPTCAGTTVTFTATPTNGGTTPSYQWKVNGANVGTNSSSYAYVPTNGDIVTCILTSSLTCTTGNPTTSNAITMTVTTPLAVSVSIVADNNPTCAGTTVTFTATSTNGGTTPVYQWKKNGSNVGSNSTTYAYIPVNGDVITCVLTSNLTCVTGNPATSNAITMTVTTPLVVSVTIVADNNPTCAGTTVTFTATPVNGGTPVYQWKKNGTNVGSNSTTYSYIPVNGDLITCVLTSNLTCVTGNPATSNAITMTVTTPLVVSVSIVADQNTVCAGTTVTFTATPTNGGTTPVYQWKKNGSNVGSNSTTYAYVPVNGDVITCVLTSNLTCVTGNPATSNAITMTVTTPLTVSVSIVANNNPTCAGTTVTFTATPVNGGTPVYQWKKNGTNVGSNSTTYSYIPVNGDVITCVLTSSLTCTTGNPATSNIITMTVNALPLANAGSDQSINYGMSTSLNGSATSGSGSYTWHWEPATLLINPNIQNPTTINLTSSVQFTLTVTDAVFGCIGLDDQVVITVTGGPLSVDATATPSTTCAGSLVQLMAIPGGGTGNYTYNWNSDPSGFTSSLQNPVVYPTISTTYTVVVNDGNSTLSDFVLVTVNPLPLVPDMPTGPDTIDVFYVTQSDYETTLLDDVSSWVWDLVPPSAGSIAWNDNLATVTWNLQYLGNASIRVKSLNSCGESAWSLEKITFVDNTTGVSFYDISPEVILYPNPNHGIFTITSSEKISRIIILDQLGKQVATIQNPDERFTYDYSYFVPGMYFVHIIGEKMNIIKKIIINN